MKNMTYKQKGKNHSGGYSGQIDNDCVQIVICAPTIKQRNRLMTDIKNVIKPISKNKFEKDFEMFLETPFKDLYMDTVLLNAMREAAMFGFNYGK